MTTTTNPEPACGAEPRNVCDSCGALYVSAPPHWAHACKRVPCGTDCPHPEMCEGAGGCPPSLNEAPPTQPEPARDGGVGAAPARLAFDVDTRTRQQPGEPPRCMAQPGRGAHVWCRRTATARVTISTGRTREGDHFVEVSELCTYHANEICKIGEWRDSSENDCVVLSREPLTPAPAGGDVAAAVDAFARVVYDAHVEGFSSDQDIEDAKAAVLAAHEAAVRAVEGSGTRRGPSWRR